jgi:hypothetical protein
VVEAPLLSVGGPLPPSLRALLLGGDFFIGAVIAASVTKLLLRLRALGLPQRELNKATASGMLLIISILRLGDSPSLPTPLDGAWFVAAVKCPHRRGVPCMPPLTPPPPKKHAVTPRRRQPRPHGGLHRRAGRPLARRRGRVAGRLPRRVQPADCRQSQPGGCRCRRRERKGGRAAG